jgi:hypothetical protein
MVLRMWHLLVVVGALALVAVGVTGGLLLGSHTEPRTKTVVQVLSVAASPDEKHADDLSSAQANVRSVIPSVEAWNADNDGSATDIDGDSSTIGYTGMTVEDLAENYDSSLTPWDYRIEWASAVNYCIESTVGSATASKTDPAGEIVEGSC